MAVLEATWPPVEVVERAGWRLRRGDGGGKRVSAASIVSSEAEIGDAAAAMTGWGQTPLFQLTPHDEPLDRTLGLAGYRIVDPTLFYVAEAGALADGASETSRVVGGGFRIALMNEIWEAGGVDEARRRVMDRAPGPKNYLLARIGDRAAGTAFVVLDQGGIAMIHAIETLARQRRKGAARTLIAAAARFALDVGAARLALAVTEANAPARALYDALGFGVAGRYHYRQSPD